MPLYETTDVQAAHHVLTQMYGVRHFSAPPRAFIRLRQDGFGRIDLHRVTFRMRGRLDGAPLGLFYLGHLLEGAGTYGGDRDYRPGDTFLVDQPHIPFDIRVDGVDVEFASLGADLLAEVADTAPGRAPAPIRFTGFTPATAQDANTWLHAFAFVRDAVGGAAQAMPPLLLDSAAQLLAAAALSAFPNNALREPTIEDRHDAHPASLRRAVAFVDEHAHLDISPADVAAAAHVTIRGLQLAFRRHLDTTPRAYLRTVRLDRAHRDLLAADPATATVGAVAGRWGFLDHSRFTALYRATYGVTPSHTLRGC